MSASLVDVRVLIENCEALTYSFVTTLSGLGVRILVGVSDISSGFRYVSYLEFL